MKEAVASISAAVRLAQVRIALSSSGADVTSSYGGTISREARG